MAKQVVIGERSRGNLEARHIEAIDEIDRRLIPAGGKPGNLDGAAVLIDFDKIVVAKFERALQFAIGRAEGAFARARQLVGRVDDLHRALLKLDRVAARGHGNTDQPLRQIDVAVMVDSNLGNDVARMAVSYRLLPDLYLLHFLLNCLRHDSVSDLQFNKSDSITCRYCPDKPAAR